MRFCFLDSSAVVKHYSIEPGSVFVHSLFGDPSAILYVSRLAQIETLCALARKKQEGHLSVQDFMAVREQFLYEWKSRLRILDVTEPVWELAANLGQSHILRAGTEAPCRQQCIAKPKADEDKGVIATFGTIRLSVPEIRIRFSRRVMAAR